MLENILVTLFGTVVFLFLFWKRLKEDYAAGIIFTVSFYILSGLLIASLFASRFFPAWFFWLGIVGMTLGLGLGILRYKVRFFESFEAIVIGGLPWLSFVYLKDSVASKSLTSFLAFLAVLVFIYLFYYLDTHFREFTWYKSGKVGFAGLASLGCVFIARATTSLFGVNVLSFSGNYEPFVSGSAAFVCFILVVNLSRKIE